MAKTKFETLIEHIINDETEAAKELFHDIVVAKSRELYNEMVSEEEETIEEAPGEDATDDMVNDIKSDEEGLTDMSMDDAGDELSDEMGMDDDMDDMDSDEEGEEGEEELEDRVVDLEAALDELKAEFDKLMSDEMNEPEHSDMADMGDMDMDKPAEGVVREYTEKAPAPVKSENGVNAKSIVDNMKNDMGGTVKNLVQGGSNPETKSAPKVKDGDYASRNVNQVGGNKGAQDFYGSKAKAKTAEEAGVNDKSPLAKG